MCDFFFVFLLPHITGAPAWEMYLTVTSGKTQFQILILTSNTNTFTPQ